MKVLINYTSREVTTLEDAPVFQHSHNLDYIEVVLDEYESGLVYKMNFTDASGTRNTSRYLEFIGQSDDLYYFRIPLNATNTAYTGDLTMSVSIFTQETDGETTTTTKIWNSETFTKHINESEQDETIDIDDEEASLIDEIYAAIALKLNSTHKANYFANDELGISGSMTTEAYITSVIDALTDSEGSYVFEGQAIISNDAVILTDSPSAAKPSLMFLSTKGLGFEYAYGSMFITGTGAAPSKLYYCNFLESSGGVTAQSWKTVLNNDDLTTLNTSIANFIDGTTVVKKAEQAEQDDHGNDINETYETKEDATTAKDRITANENNISYLESNKENIANKITSLSISWDYLYSSTNGSAYAYDYALANLNDANITPGVAASGYSEDDVVRVSDGDIITPTYYWYQVVQTEVSDINYMSAKLIKALLDLKEDSSNKGAINGYAPLVNGKVPSAYMPNGYDNYEEVATYADLPTEGVEGTVYVVIADETSGGNTSTYRWTGSVYGKISDTLSTSEVKTLYEANADVNAYTDAEKTKLTALYTKAQLDTLFNNRYTKTEVDALLDNLKAVYGWQDTSLADGVASGATVNNSVWSGHEYIVLIATDGTNTYTTFVRVSDLIDGDTFTVGSGTFVVGTTTSTFTYSGFNLDIMGIKLEQQLAENIQYETSVTIKDRLSGSYKETQSITYLADGKVSQVVGDNVTTTPTYDEYGNITKITEVYALDGKTYETTFTRNSEGKIINTNKQEVI